MADLLILANKRFHTDFRKYLMRAAERANASALHVYCWERIILSQNGQEFMTFPADTSERLVLREIEKRVNLDRLIVLTGLGCNESHVATQIQGHLEKAFTIYDVYDDLMFESEGYERLDRMLQDSIWRCRCDAQILLNKNLAPRYPLAFHLDNASHLRRGNAGTARLPLKCAYIGSIDRRVDFDWLRSAGHWGHQIDIYGRWHPNAPDAERALRSLESEFANVRYCGPYDNDDLWVILPKYNVGLLPYRVSERMTRFINPDKLYHYLNAGLEVLSAPIEPVKEFGKYIFTIETKGEWSKILRRLQAEPRAAAWPSNKYSWDARWTELGRIAADASADISQA